MNSARTLALVTMSDVIKKNMFFVQDKRLVLANVDLAFQVCWLTNPVALFFLCRKSLLAYFLKVKPPKNYGS